MSIRNIDELLSELPEIEKKRINYIEKKKVIETVDFYIKEKGIIWPNKIPDHIVKKLFY